MAELTADVIGRAVFGGKLGAAAATQVVANFSAYQKTVEQMDLISLLGLPDFFPRWHGRATLRAADRIKTLVAETIAALETAEPEDRGALASLMVDAFQAEGVAPDDIRDEATVLLMAGHETTANTLAWAWYCLSQDEASWQALAEEVRALGRPPTDLEDVKRLPFARAVIDETLRLYPPVPFLSRRSREARDVDGHHMPARSLVMIVPWLLHRHRKHWRDPDLFDPWRFMPGGSGVPDRYCYIPFSIGPRICTGMAFALTEATICLATLALIARPMPRRGHVVMPVARLSLRPGDDLPMVLTPGVMAA
jgi:cytochrome P450